MKPVSSGLVLSVQPSVGGLQQINIILTESKSKVRITLSLWSPIRAELNWTQDLFKFRMINSWNKDLHFTWVLLESVCNLSWTELLSVTSIHPEGLHVKHIPGVVSSDNHRHVPASSKGAAQHERVMNPLFIDFFSTPNDSIVKKILYKFCRFNSSSKFPTNLPGKWNHVNTGMFWTKQQLDSETQATWWAERRWKHWTHRCLLIMTSSVYRMCTAVGFLLRSGPQALSASLQELQQVKPGSGDDPPKTPDFSFAGPLKHLPRTIWCFCDTSTSTRLESACSPCRQAFQSDCGGRSGSGRPHILDAEWKLPAGLSCEAFCQQADTHRHQGQASAAVQDHWTTNNTVTKISK